ncbi:protoporphyrinogen oxidase [Corynebacterium pseudotuberculosis]|uniref:protoporphyrinogen oxidase n=1 Tax=Corynebacterium pseudotuberculosis TaxID=1719 RepID=UPI00071919CD|nr:protoporphyrinogen oxidase [Corynebacterium pseudotuberculosis]ALP33020.1 Protoporphyrinogen oxidase [Corynebacterium pseudotuberculosis]ALR32935.1 Protoporphyrinogen oxidase [Corynebacterium pseudotuberculosis]APX35478.1 protoporphyrinogen oxidase [Corynebacterium pseudotuberculosis]APX37319.1 protoporphyrinogen oxidase [Corynebacterium pseudotuberculosis]AQL50399.1 Protoporphyrinogen IX oxidase, aerobic [Corynebacterium pseudotuberculosis]
MRIAIIGAGLAGLTAAYEIHKLAPHADVEVFEATDRIGGKLFTVPFASGPTDMGAEAYLAFREDTTEFFKELGLEESLRSPSGLPSLLYQGGSLHSMPSNTIMGIPGTSEDLGNLVSEETRKRIDSEINAESIEWPQEISLGALLRERLGDDVVDHVVSTLQGGVYSSTSDDLSVRATVPQLARALDKLKEEGKPVTITGAVQRLLSEREERNKKRGYTPSVFASFAGGYAEMYEALAERSEAKIHIDAFITAVDKKPEGFVLKGAEGVFDKVLLTVPAPTAALLLKNLVPEAAQQLKTIKLASSAVVGMKFDNSAGLPDNSGILVATNAQDVRAKAFTFSSKKWPHLGERGGALVRASFGRFGEDAIARADEDELVDAALDDLQTITGFDGRAAGLSEIFVQRWFGGLPVYGPGHLDTVAAIKKALAQVEGIDATGAWADGVGVPAVIDAAKAAAKRALA